MLRELHIKNVAVIEEAVVEFDDGFQTLTGETGAGKSILIDSINMALGGRGSRDIVRTGADFAQVDIAFEVENDEICRYLSELGIECEDGTVLISRKLMADGKSRSHINGKMTPLNVVREVGELLLTIHGQNDNQSILLPKTHLKFVDEFGGNDELLGEYKTRYAEVKKVRTMLSELEADEHGKNELIELLSFQVDEIDSAKLKSGEEEELEERRNILRNSEQLAEDAGGAYYALHGGDEDSDGAMDALSEAVRYLEEAKEFDSRLVQYYETLSSVVADVENVMYELRVYSDGIEYSREELDNAESRLSLIASLKRKYGSTVDEILEYADKSRERLAVIESSDERREELTKKLEEEKEKLAEVGARLTAARKGAAKELEEKIMKELSDLDMKKMRFSAEVRMAEDSDGNQKFTSEGCDDVEFMISANPGEELKPLAKIASGGEMSRIMLAIKSVLSDSDSVETMIFDEIDTGVSGRAAQKIAEKMGMLAKKRQILCITHLAQIAAMADSHYMIEKNSDGVNTKTTVYRIEGEERIQELARIIGGVSVTELTLSAAREMLNMAKEYKE